MSCDFLLTQATVALGMTDGQFSFLVRELVFPPGKATSELKEMFINDLAATKIDTPPRSDVSDLQWYFLARSLKSERGVRRRWRISIRAALSNYISSPRVVEAALVYWSTNTNGHIHSAAQDEAQGWKPPTLTECGYSGTWTFSLSGVRPAFDPVDYWGDGDSDDDLASDASGEAKRSVITTANGVFDYSDDWDGVGSASGPAMAAARLLHVARQMTDTSR